MSALAGKVALVTGASRGIGAAIAARLRQEGAMVARVARTLRAARQDGLLDIPCDLTQDEDVRHAADVVTAQLGTPDLVVNNAGGFLLSPVAETTPQAFDTQVGLNLRAPFLVARAFLPAMRARGAGMHVAIGSIADHRAFPGNAAYAASKFGLRGLHEVLVEEYRGSGVRCVLVSPGPTDTPIWDPVDPDHREGFTPRDAMLRPEDVADAVAWVATRPARVHVEWLRLVPG